MCRNRLWVNFSVLFESLVSLAQLLLYMYFGDCGILQYFHKFL
jgi:hypothetical protein